MARKKAPPKKLTSAITALDGMAAFIGIWTGEALKRLKVSVKILGQEDQGPKLFPAGPGHQSPASRGSLKQDM